MAEDKLIHAMRIWFFDYLENYFSGLEEYDKKLIHKKNHTLRVLDEIIEISTAEGISGNLFSLAQIAALFHDVGRFEQFSKYGTFADSRSENHAELSITIMKRENVLDGLENEDRELIYAAIRNHNKPLLDEIQSKEVKILSNLLRDADKLDNLYVVLCDRERIQKEKRETHYFGLSLEGGYNEKLLKRLLQKETISYAEAANANEFLLLQLGWIYDIHYKTTLKHVLKRNYVERCIGVLPPHPLLNEYIKKIRNYIDTKL